MKMVGSTLSDSGFVEVLLGQVKAGRRVALCSVLSTRGSMPRPADARMALLETGEFIGTIGGGRIEFLGQQRCRELLQAALQDERASQGCSELRWYTRSETGMLCGGDALVAIRMLGREDEPVLEEALRHGFAGGLLVEDWSCAERPTWHVEAAEQASRPQVPTWDESSSLYTEPLNRPEAVYLYGAGHVSQALSPVLASLGFDVNVFDERADLLTAERFPEAGRLQTCRFSSLAEDEQPSARDYAIIMTPSHESDYDVLEQMVRRSPAYVGCIGSRGKTAKFRGWLTDAGIATDRIDAVHMPIGDPIGAVTPAELAISIAAEIIRFRAQLRCAPRP